MKSSFCSLTDSIRLMFSFQCEREKGEGKICCTDQNQTTLFNLNRSSSCSRKHWRHSLLPCTGTQDGIRRNYHPPREDISRPWPVRWWNCTRNQHIFHTKSKQQLPPVAALNHQPVRLTARPRTWLKKPNDHLALHALWWLAQKCAKEEVLASHFTSPNSGLVKQPALLQIRNPSVWFSLRVWGCERQSTW